MTFSDLVAPVGGRWLPKEPFLSWTSVSGGRAVDITAKLQETAGWYVTAVVVLPVLEDLCLQQSVLSPLDSGKFTCLACSPLLTKALMVNSWLKGWRQSLKVPSTYQFLAFTSCWICWLVANTKCRLLRIQTSAFRKSAGIFFFWDLEIQVGLMVKQSWSYDRMSGLYVILPFIHAGGSKFHIC